MYRTSTDREDKKKKKEIFSDAHFSYGHSKPRNLYIFKAGLLRTIITIPMTILMNMLKYQCNFQQERAKIANSLV